MVPFQDKKNVQINQLLNISQQIPPTTSQSTSLIPTDVLTPQTNQYFIYYLSSIDWPACTPFTFVTPLCNHELMTNMSTGLCSMTTEDTSI